MAMNKAVMGLSLMMLVFVLGTISTATMQFLNTGVAERSDEDAGGLQPLPAPRPAPTQAFTTATKLTLIRNDTADDAGVSTTEPVTPSDSSQPLRYAATQAINISLSTPEEISSLSLPISESSPVEVSDIITVVSTRLPENVSESQSAPVSTRLPEQVSTIQPVNLTESSPPEQVSIQPVDLTESSPAQSEAISAVTSPKVVVEGWRPRLTSVAPARPAEEPPAPAPATTDASGALREWIMSLINKSKTRKHAVSS